MPADRGQEERMVRCNHCMSIFDETYLILEKQGIDFEEKCPVCKKSDALMDIPLLEKFLSPEVRLGIEKLLDAIKRRNAGFPLDYETEIMTIEYCEKLLEARE